MGTGWSYFINVCQALRVAIAAAWTLVGLIAVYLVITVGLPQTAICAAFLARPSLHNANRNGGQSAVCLAARFVSQSVCATRHFRREPSIWVACRSAAVRLYELTADEFPIGEPAIRITRRAPFATGLPRRPLQRSAQPPI